MTSSVALGPVVGSALVVVLAAALVRASGMNCYIGDNRGAVVEKLSSFKGGLIAMPETRASNQRLEGKTVETV